MKYIITLLALCAFASCDTERSYQCECSGIRGHVLYGFKGEYKEAKDGIPACELAEDSLTAAAPGEGAQCFFYRIDD